MRRFHVFHDRQPDGDFVATCDDVPGWFCFGESLEETTHRAELDMRDHILGRVVLRHFQIPEANLALRQS